MKFNKNLDWLKESDEDDILGDELDDVKGDEEQINEVRYINPDNLDRYNPDEIEEVTTASGEKRYKRKSGFTSNRTVDKKEEPKQTSSNIVEEVSLNYSNTMKNYAKSQKAIGSLYKKMNNAIREGRRLIADDYQKEISKLETEQKSKAGILAKQMQNMSKEDVFKTIKMILDNSGMPSHRWVTFVNRVVASPLDNGKTLEEQLGYSSDNAYKLSIELEEYLTGKPVKIHKNNT